ncbi:acetate--CoA ligase family protein, partial [Candidatus Micrarchaeota archaeon]|nr:acetate--CoA ligase family protein [Candidatus Micrarchaeota archaeon]
MKQLPFEQAKHLLRKYDVEFAESETTASESHAVKAAQRIGFPVVLKIDSPDVIHKSDAGMVLLNVASVSGVHEAFKAIMKKAKRKKAHVNGVLVQKQGSGYELIVGAKRDAQFGPVIVFGMGGVFVEIMKDVAMRIAPVSRVEAHRMIKETKAYEVLKGARGGVRVDIEAIAALIARVSNVMMDNSEIRELDLNPCFADEKGYVVVDARIIVG